MRTLPKAPERLFLEIGILAFWVPSVWKILETVPKIILKKKKKWKFIFTGPGLAEMSNGCIVLDRKMCPDLLEALKPAGDP